MGLGGLWDEWMQGVVGRKENAVAKNLVKQRHTAPPFMYVTLSNCI